jgi:hypothetical protein
MMTPVRNTGTKYRGLNPEGLAPHKFTPMLGVPCTGVRESGGFEVENLSRVPGDACRSSNEPLVLPNRLG